MSSLVKLSIYRSNYKRPSALLWSVWAIVSLFFFETRLPFPSKLKCSILRLFGATIGIGVVIRPMLKIKYPWMLKIGNYSWLGERVWIDNLEQVSIGSNCCLSQGVYLCTGSHNYKFETFDLIVKPIVIDDGVWLGAFTCLAPGSQIGKYCVLTMGSIAKGVLSDGWIYCGNPATKTRLREFQNEL